MVLHPLLLRQLKRVAIDPQGAFDAAGAAALGQLLERVSRAYEEHDQEHYLLERSQQLASAEMTALHDTVRADHDLLDRTGTMSGVGGWQVDLATQSSSWTDHAYRILDLEPGPPGTPRQAPTLVETFGYYAPQARPVIQQACHVALAGGGGWDLELPMVTAKGRAIWVRVLGAVEFAGGQPVRIAGAVQDITARRAMQADLVRATEAAEESSRAKSELIAVINHELRTPLQSILGFSDLGRLLATAAPQLDEMFGEIHAGGLRMLALVNGLLDLSKSERTLDAVALTRSDVGNLVRAVARELGPIAAQRGLRIELPDPLPCLSAHVDPTRIQQVFRNVLANALRFAPDDSRIEVGLSDGGTVGGTDGIEVTVRDHGPGIPPEELETVFDAFVQSSRTRDGSGGTGLGLTICRKIIHAHGGSIAAGNAAGGGAMLRIRLPRRALEAETDGEARADPA
jgi:signal transduction histidine kinase